MFLGTLQYQEKETCQQQREHLWTYSQNRSRAYGSPQRKHSGNIRTSRTSQINQQGTHGNDCCESDNQSSPSCQPIRTVHRNLGEPLVVDPWLANTSKRVGIRMKHLMILNNQLTGA